MIREKQNLHISTPGKRMMRRRFLMLSDQTTIGLRNAKLWIIEACLNTTNTANGFPSESMTIENKIHPVYCSRALKWADSRMKMKAAYRAAVVAHERVRNLKLSLA